MRHPKAVCSAARLGQEHSSEFHVESSPWQAGQGESFVQICSSQISENFYFAPTLTKYTVTIPCHCPISWNSYFNSIALDIARGKQCYLRKADFLNLHLTDIKSSNTNQNLTHLLHPSHVQLWCLGDPNEALSQRHPDFARSSTTCWPPSIYSVYFLQPTTD